MCRENWHIADIARVAEHLVSIALATQSELTVEKGSQRELGDCLSNAEAGIASNDCKGNGVRLRLAPQTALNEARSSDWKTMLYSENKREKNRENEKSERQQDRLQGRTLATN